MSPTFLWSSVKFKGRFRPFIFAFSLFFPSFLIASDSSVQLWGAWSHTAPNTFNQSLLADQPFSSAYGAGLDLKWGVSHSLGFAFRSELWEWSPAATNVGSHSDYGLQLNPLLLGVVLREPGLIDQLSFELGLFAGVGLAQFSSTLHAQNWYADIFMGEVSVKVVYELTPHYQTFLMGLFRYAQNAQFGLLSGSNDPPADLSGPAIAYGIGYIF